MPLSLVYYLTLYTLFNNKLEIVTVPYVLTRLYTIKEEGTTIYSMHRKPVSKFAPSLNGHGPAMYAYLKPLKLPNNPPSVVYIYDSDMRKTMQSFTPSIKISRTRAMSLEVLTSCATDWPKGTGHVGPGHDDISIVSLRKEILKKATDKMRELIFSSSDMKLSK